MEVTDCILVRRRSQPIRIESNMLVFLDNIPDSILGVIIGSLLAFGGTSVATFFQLRHDAKQRERDRKMQLRRELFLEAAEGAPGPEYFIKVANPDVPLSELGVPTAKPAWMNKLFAA